MLPTSDQFDGVDWLLIFSKMLGNANTASPKLHSFCQIFLVVLYVKFLAVNCLSGKINAKINTNLVCENNEKA